MPVFNKMVYNWTEYILWWWGNIWEPLNLTVTTSWLDATIKWEDNEIWTIPPTTFQKSELVRKIGSAPTSPSDWDLVVTETVKDTYKVSWYVDQWLTEWETYYYRVFSYSDLGGISYCDAVNVTPSAWWWQPWVNTVAYLPLSSDLDDTISWNNLTWNATFGTIWWSTVNCAITTNGWLSGTLANLPQGTAERTVSMRFYFSGSNTNEWWTVFYGTWWGNNQVFGAYSELNGSDWKISLSQRWANSWYLYTWTTGSWYLITMTYDSNNIWTLYINWAYMGNWNVTLGTIWNDILLWSLVWNTWDYLSWGFSELIIEDKCWTSQEVSDYYDLTKANYWF